MSRALRNVVAVGVVVGLLAACRTGGGPGPVSPSVSYETHMAEATKLEEEATRHAQAAEVARQRGATYRCDTAPETEQATSGTERFHGTRVCSDVAQDDQRRHDREAKKLRAQANRHRAQARSLVDAERTACAGFGVDRLRETPLGRARGALRAEPIDGGVRVTLGPAGPGLSVDDVRREVACHRARAALYDDGGYMAHDPALVAGTRVAVESAGGAIVVTVRGEDPVATENARQRAAALR